MKAFLRKIFYFFLCGLVPLAVLLVGYVCLDPFKVLKQYDSYKDLHVIPNVEYISTELFLHNRDRCQYNSFIFGSSKTLAFRTASWRQHLRSDSRPFLFDASCENIEGVYYKLRFLDSLHQPLRNVLIILDRDGFFSTSRDSMGHLYLRHPMLDGGSQLNFQAAFFKGYLHPKFLLGFYGYVCMRRYKEFMAACISERGLYYDSITNEIDLHEIENNIRTDSTRFYARLKDVFYDRKGAQEDSVARLGERYAGILDKIGAILRRNRTDYRVIICPAYEQIRFNQKDLSLLKAEFGDHLYDFSGDNYFTNDKGHYYETNHFRPLVGDSILKILYP